MHEVNKEKFFYGFFLFFIFISDWDPGRGIGRPNPNQCEDYAVEAHYFTISQIKEVHLASIRPPRIENEDPSQRNRQKGFLPLLRHSIHV